jgi:hypothetical protein
MTPEDIRIAINNILTDKIILSWWQLGPVMLLTGLAAFVGTYLKKKGENLATKEDIEGLTRQIESVKTDYAQQLESFKAQLQEERQKRDRAWLVKRDSCLKALNIANALLSNYSYQNVTTDQIHPQEIDVVDVRACFNELACSCENPEVIAQLKHIMFDKVSPDAIVDLRNAVRRELEFGINEVDTDRERAFIGRVVGQKKGTNSGGTTPI